MTGPDDADLIAVVGMAGRFPGAADIDEFWRNILAGKDSVTRQTTQDGRGSAFGVLADATAFDADFFGFSPREALLLDPQQRVLLECAWHALENAGLTPGSTAGAIGVYAGAAQSTYAEALLARREERELGSEYQVRLGSGIDFVTTRVSHRLGLTGPAVTVQTACSTSLVAIHTAATALLSGDCDIALAGGVSIHLDWRDSGQGAAGVLAADGFCRPFDAAGAGTVPGSGVALVVLRRLDEALADGHTVHAVLRGSGVANDGTDRIGFTAPSVQGQLRAIRAALRMAQVDPASVGFVEAHGTGTALGDPIEVKALTLGYGGPRPHREPRCLGSVKSAVGHLDAAAGVAGFITAVLAVRDGQIPPTLHFRSANPEADLTRVPFEIAVEARTWPLATGPRRAAVSSFGLGGTNAHAILEQPPAADPGTTTDGRELLVLSARTPQALAEMSRRLAEHLSAPDCVAGLSAVASTLDSGRAALPFRRYVVADDAAAAAARLREHTHTRAADDPPEVFFLYPGHGSQYPGMVEGVPRHEPDFAAALDDCARLVAEATGRDLYGMLTAPDLSDDLVAGQLATFSVEWATTALWRAWGVHPAGVLGHSLGGIAAACVAGVIDLDAAVGFVAERARLLADLPGGAMLAVTAGEDELMERFGLTLAVVNGPSSCVLAGSVPDIGAAEQWLRDKGIRSMLLKVPGAGHSRLVEPALPGIRAAAARLAPKPAAVPWLSETTGDWVGAEAATDPERWVGHTRRPVRFDLAVGRLLRRPGTVLLEVGPGGVLGALTRRHDRYDGRLVCSSLPHPNDDTDAHAHLLAALGRLWCAGVTNAGRRRPQRKVPLPGYPFDRSVFAPDVEPPQGTVIARAAGSAARTPRDPAEQAVVDAFARVLGVHDITGDDNFFDLGGDSLIATQVVAALEADWGVSVPATALFRAPTVRDFATVVGRAGERDVTASVWANARSINAAAARETEADG